MEVLDDAGRVRRSAEVVAHLGELVQREPALARLAEARWEDMPWGATSTCFTGRWTPAATDALLKVGVSSSQRFWSEAVAHSDPELAPRVFASGDRLGGTRIGWVLMERLPGGLHPGWGGAQFGMLMDAGARFQRLAREVDSPPVDGLGVETVESWLVSAAEREAPGPVATLLERLPEDWAVVTEACGTEICHGDLHMANALMRVPAPEPGRALLIDFEPCRMPWVFDAAYPQVLNSDPAIPGWHDLVGLLAERRRHHGLPTAPDPELRRVAAIALAWYAARMWGVFGAEPDPGWRSAEVWREQNRRYLEAGAAA